MCFGDPVTNLFYSMMLYLNTNTLVNKYLR